MVKHVNYDYQYGLNAISNDLRYTSLAKKSDYGYLIYDVDIINGHLEFHSHHPHPIEIISKFCSKDMESLLPLIDNPGNIFVNNLKWINSLSRIFKLSFCGLGQNCFGRKTFTHHDYT